ncbi:hypothetical protein FIBSPDRAFT_932916 [Athelia psychrophila]|uniref:VASt domain-containing protein n=1 Tax=Athelia psychrophila TaxID=1759441 RepID=A0A166I043_9AGAM|nr:hypothetical protein FIBSPDRAFT_932916 [Fibularhizoctonia sp. CBS 109695]
MGSKLSLLNDSDVRCNIKVYTVGRSFVVIHSNLRPGQETKHDLHKVWYDIVYDFDDGQTYEDPGVYFGEDVNVKLSDVVANLERNARLAVTANQDPPKSDTASQPLLIDNEAVESTCVSHHPPTADGGEAYPKLAIEADFTCTPSVLFRLMYREKAFMEHVREQESSVHDVKIGEWAPVDEGAEGIESRKLSFTMTLSGAVGPSQTSCNIVETIEHYDEDAYIAVQALTRTPDVPYGQSFATLTRTCLTWNKQGGTRMTVNLKMKWEKSTMLKGVIESQANEGQTKYNQVLAKRIGEWIAAHPADFPVQTPAPEEPSTGVAIHSGPESTEVTPLLVSGSGSGSGSEGSAVSPPIPIIPILALMNIVTLALLIWSWTRPCPC